MSVPVVLIPVSLGITLFRLRGLLRAPDLPRAGAKTTRPGLANAPGAWGRITPNPSRATQAPAPATTSTNRGKGDRP